MASVGMLRSLVPTDIRPSVAAIERRKCHDILRGMYDHRLPRSIQGLICGFVKVYIFDMGGLTGNIGLISSGIQYAIFIVGTAATFFFIDATGRRPLLIYGAVGMGICMMVVGGVLGSYGTPLPEGLE